MYSFKKLLLYFLKLGFLGFGGPIALVGYMQKELQEKRGWLTKEEYVRGLALSQLSPGPMATQLAMYIGYIKAGKLGTALVSFAFLLPSFAMVVLLGMAYVRFGNLLWVHAIFYGISAAVIGIIVRSAYKLSKVILKQKKLLWTIACILALTTAITQQENLVLFIVCGFITLFTYAPPKFVKKFLPINLALATPVALIFQPFSSNIFFQLFTYFSIAGTVVFGSGLAIVPFLYGGVVQQHHWLTQRQFLDAVAVSMITPGPVVITSGFIGYLVAGFWGALLAALGVFLPVYLFVIILTPLFERHKENPQFVAFIEGLTAAASGGIFGAIFILGRQSITDIPTLLIAAGTFFAIIRFKLPEVLLIFLAGVLGLLVFFVK